MPLKWVLQWQPNPGTTVNRQALSEVSQCVETIHGVKEGHPYSLQAHLARLGWRGESLVSWMRLVYCTNAAEFPRDFIGMLLPEQPNKCYFTLRSNRIVVETDMSVQNIMEKLRLYRSRVALIFVGSQYQLGDFQLRVGKVIPSHSENLRGTVMEIEYLPLSSLKKSRQVMQDFIDIWQETLSKRSLPGHFIHVEPNFSEFSLLDNYTSQHTAVLYATVMAQLIASASAQLAPGVRN